MAITVLSDVIVPDCIAREGVSGKNVRLNFRSYNRAGYGQATISRNRTLREINLGVVPLPREDWETLEALFEVTAGGAYGMLAHDPKDYVCSTGVLQGLQGTESAGVAGFGHGVPAYRMYQRKAAMGTTRTYDRRVTRPASPSALTRGGSPVTIGVAAGNAAVDYDTGTVTFVANATRNVTSVTPGATTSITLATAIPGVAIGGRLYLTGLTGANAALLNGLSHAVTNIVGAVYTLSTVTTGATITVGAGVGHAYPQPTEALAWTGEFYIPVQFRDDFIDWDGVLGGDYEDRLIAGPSVILVEILEP